MKKVTRARPAKAVRYWPGRGQEQEMPSESSGSESEGEIEKEKEEMTTIASIATSATTAPIIDRRMLRLQRTNNASSSDSDEEEEENTARRRHGSARRREEAGEAVPERENHEEDEDAIAERRRRLREAAAERAALEATNMPVDIHEGRRAESSGSESGSESGSDSDSDSEEELHGRRTMLKPVFIPKSSRETIHERERLEKEAEEAEQKRLLDLEARKIESHNLVEEELRKEVAAATVNDTIPDVDDTDGLDEEEEFEAWKLRELMRIKRDRQERDAEEKELADIERRRNMTDAELLAEDEKLNGGKEEDKKSYKFMQKYYHKGAFFNDEEILQKRDFNEPTLEDKFDKSILPEVMQVKNFGRAGQTKWTHLSKEDTSSKDSAWFQNSDVNKRTLSKLGGFKQGYDKPTSRKRAKNE
ncbi:hypothetical protein CcCBS67573_g01473 [Chytriomyces confervae]|uniref:Micro-fibrillar-associated protein 1 C-terminal domain-containing protein n=1 Tax=Chytriomyces confervae TaxID=246404 RepID=A0A507FLF2_9FUNG|nr:hypothetical protein CcCBS67573_g01473 [Chytriomyces confervae]